MSNPQDYIDHVLGSLPTWFTRNDRNQENIKAFAELFCQTQDHEEFWNEMSYILTATVDAADWLDQHARDRGTTRQTGEADSPLRARLRTPADALIKSAVEAAVQSVLDSEGISGTPGLFELRPNSAFFRTLTALTGTGGTFAITPGGMNFTPDVPVENISLFYDSHASSQLVISGALSPANDGTFPITDFNNDALVFINGGVGEADATVSWTVNRLDSSSNILDGFRQSYLSRGYRFADVVDIVIILPFGCTAGTVAGVQESLRQKVGAGISSLVECRANP